MRSKNYGINVRVTEQEKQKLLPNEHAPRREQLAQTHLEIG